MEIKIKSQIRLITTVLILISLPTMADMYRYVDENGQVVYTQFRPGAEVNAATIQGPPSPPSTAKHSREALIENLTLQAESREDKKEAAREAEKARQEKEREEQLKQNCETAKKNLEYLQAQDRRKLVDKDGNSLSMSNTERVQRIKKAREVMQRDCK
jgi:hypothetical protein